MKKYLHINKNPIFLIVILLVLISSCWSPFTCDKWRKENIRYKEFKGTISVKKEFKNCDGIIVINKTDTLPHFCPCGLWREKWNMINVSDSIIKNYGSDSIKIITKDTILKFLYPCCDE